MSLISPIPNSSECNLTINNICITTVIWNSGLHAWLKYYFYLLYTNTVEKGSVSSQYFISIMHVKARDTLKGHRHDWWCLFTISFFPKLLYISSMNPSNIRTTIFKLIVHGIELHAAFEERENKQKNAKFKLIF